MHQNNETAAILVHLNIETAAILVHLNNETAAILVHLNNETAAILVNLNNEMAAILVLQKKILGGLNYFASKNFLLLQEIYIVAILVSETICRTWLARSYMKYLIEKKEFFF